MPTARACPACLTPLPEQAHFCNNCGAPTPTDPGTPPRTTGTHDVGELAKVRRALAGTYKVERALGAGGMATVYLAEDLKHRRKVAVKVMRPELAETLGADRFLREIEIAAALSHPHILPVYDSGSAGGILYYVMPLVEGESLQEKLTRESQLPVEDALRITREVAEALAYAHERGIIHRDIKPANIMLSRGHALVADFGIARAVSGGATITKTGLAVGTPQYMSPEQATGSGGVDGRSDVYAMGCVLYEMLAGEPPFSGPTPQAIIARSLVDTPRSLTGTRSSVTPALDGVITRALAKSPADRFQTAEAFSQALGGAATVSGITRGVPTPRTGPTPLTVWGLFGFASAVTLGLFYGLVHRWGLPGWILPLAIVLLAIGGAVLLVTGRMESRRRHGHAPTGALGWFTWKNAAIGGALALGTWAVLVTWFVIQGPGGSAAPAGVVRLAVMPFENRGPTDQAYFVDGIADQVRGKLTALGSVQVIARTSTDQYRQTTKSPQAIGKELGVDYLLGATVAWAKSADGTGRVQVSPELIDVKTGASKWQQSFDASVTDVFQVQGTIATQVAGALGIALGTQDQKQLAARPTDNLAAYDAFLKARSTFGNDPVTLKRAVGLYEQAVALDSTFTEAWAGLSATLSILYFNGTSDPVVGARALAAAERTTRLDPDGAQAHYAMSRYYFLIGNDPERADREAKLALAKAPNDTYILRHAASVERSLGQLDQALEHAQLGRQLDPRSVSSIGALQAVLASLRRYPDALAAGQDALALNPSLLVTIQGVVITHLEQGDLAGAREIIRTALKTVPPTELAAYFANYNDLYWVLEEEQQRLVTRLTPEAFDGDRATWAAVEMETFRNLGDQTRARAYADTAIVETGKHVQANAADAQSLLFRGIALATAGRKADAIRDGLKGMAITPLSKDRTTGAYFQGRMIQIYLLVGEKEKALDLIEELLKANWYLTPQWLRIDPMYASLQGNPRFERLASGK